MKASTAKKTLVVIVILVLAGSVWLANSESARDNALSAVKKLDFTKWCIDSTLYEE